MLAKDGVQSIDDITRELMTRSRPPAVQKDIDQSVKYTIEDVYKNEISWQREQAIANISSEQKFIDAQIDKFEDGDKGQGRYLKNNDTRSYFDKYAKADIEDLLKRLNKHELYVNIDINGDDVKLSGVIYRLVTIDGVQQKKTYATREVVLSRDQLEATDGTGYKLSIDKIIKNEESYHDKKALAWKKQHDEADVAQIAEEDEDQQREETKEDKEPEPVAVEENTPKPQPEEKNVKAESIQNIISDLDKVEAEPTPFVPEPVEIVQPVVPPAPVVETQDMTDYVEPSDDDLLSELLGDLMAQRDRIMPNRRSFNAVKTPVAPRQPIVQSEPQSNYAAYPQFSESSPRSMDSDMSIPTEGADASNERKETHLYLTQHQMKVDNFRRAAQEIKDRIISIYGGDEQSAEKDEDYMRLEEYVQNRLQQEANNVDVTQAVVDWLAPENNAEYTADYQKKVAGFAKKFDDNTFASISDRAGGVTRR